MRRRFLLLAGLALCAARPAAAQDTRGELCWWTTEVDRCRNIVIAELGLVVPLAGGVREYIREDPQVGLTHAVELTPARYLSAEVGVLHSFSRSVAAGVTLQFLNDVVQMSARARRELPGRSFVDGKVGIIRARGVMFEEGLGGDPDRVGISLEARLGRHRVASLGLRYDDVSWPELPTREPPRYYWLDGETGGRQRSLAGVVTLEPPGTVAGTAVIGLLLGAALVVLSGWEG